MLTAKESDVLNLKKIKKKNKSGEYDYYIYNIFRPEKISKENIHQYKLKNAKDIGIILHSKNMVKEKRDDIIISNKRMYDTSIENNIILKLNKPKESSYLNWLQSLPKKILPLNPYMVLIPLDAQYNYAIKKDCDMFIQEINSILFEYSKSTIVVFYQHEEMLSSLSYIIQKLQSNHNVSLCLNLDYVLAKYDLNYFKSLVYKYLLKDYTLVLENHTHDLSKKDINQLENIFSNNIIYFGN